MIQRFLSDAVWNLLAQLGLYAGNFVALWLLARLLDPSEYGEFTVALSVIAIFQIVVSFGVPNSTAKLLSEHRGRKSKALSSIFREGLFLTVVFNLAGLALYLASVGPISRLMDSENLRRLLVGGGAFLALRAFSEFFMFVLQGFQRFDYKTYMNLVTGVGYVVFSFLAVWMGYGAVGAMVGLGVACLISAAFAFWKLRSRVLARAVDRVTIDWRVLKYSLPLVIASLSSYTYRRVDTLLVRYFVSAAETGFYGIAQRIVDALLLPIGTLAAVVLQMVAFNYDGGVESSVKLEKMFNLLNKYTIMAIFPIMVLGITAGRETIALIWTSKYDRAGILFSVLCIDLICRCLVTGSPFLIATGKASYVSRAFGISVIVNMVLIFVLVPSYGAMGAVVASLITDGFVVIAMLYLVVKLLGIRISREFIWSLPKMGLAGGAMACFDAFLFSFCINTAVGRWTRLVLGGLLSVLIYFAILLLIKGITVDELRPVITRMNVKNIIRSRGYVVDG